MKCPSCNSINRDERTQCYHCSADLTVLQTVIIKAKHHYNAGLEHAERGRLDDAIADLKTAVSIYNDFSQAHNVLGTLYAKQEKWEQAIAQWQQTLNLDPANKKAADYLYKAKLTLEEPLLSRQNRLAKQILSAMAIILAFLLLWQYHIHSLNTTLHAADTLIQESKYTQAYTLLEPVSKSFSYLYQSAAKARLDRISGILETKIAAIKSFLAQKQYEQGITIVNQLHVSGIPAQWTHTVDTLENSLYTGLLDQDTTKAFQIYEEKKDYWTAKGILKALDKRLTDPKKEKALAQAINDLKDKWVDQNYKLAVDYQQKKDYARMNMVIVELQKESLDTALTMNLIEMEKQSGKNNAKQLLSNQTTKTKSSPPKSSKK